MKREDFKHARVLVASAKPHVIQVMRHVLAFAGIGKISAATSAQRALESLTVTRMTAVFCDDSCGELEDKSFAHVVRRHETVLNPMVPLFLMCAGPRQRDVELARDSGYNDVLCRPVSAATVLRKLRQATDNPRSFIATNTFFGPDRRAEQRPEFHGRDRRKRMPRKVKVSPDAFSES
jgi:two-component system, chemotaxis family, chemotaxis protein CheY